MRPQLEHALGAEQLERCPLRCLVAQACCRWPGCSAYHMPSLHASYAPAAAAATVLVTPLLQLGNPLGALWTSRCARLRV